MSNEMRAGNERLPLNGADVLIKGRVEDDGAKLVRRRKQKFSLSARTAMGYRLLFVDLKHKAASADSGFFDSSIKLILKPFDRIASVQALIRDRHDVGPEFHSPIGSFKEDINGRNPSAGSC